jgi:hypothetical protein
MISKHPLMLIISHNIALTREERYKLVNKEKIEVIGASVPVWHYKGDTSEPAVEVFGKYYISNEDGRSNVKGVKDGYLVNLPQMPENWEEPYRPTNDEWRSMTASEQEGYREILRNYPRSANNLRDVSDKGSQYLSWEEHNKIKEKDRNCSVSHIVEIRTVESLEESIID